jgi:hypothetical protein
MGRIRSKTGRKSGQKTGRNRVGKSMVSDGSEMRSKSGRKSGSETSSDRVEIGSETGRKRGVARKTSKFGLNCNGKQAEIGCPKMGRKHGFDRYLEGKRRKVQILSGLDARKIDVFDFLRILSLGFRVGRARIGSVRHGFGSDSDSDFNGKQARIGGSKSVGNGSE